MAQSKDFQSKDEKSKNFQLKDKKSEDFQFKDEKTRLFKRADLIIFVVILLFSFLCHTGISYYKEKAAHGEKYAVIKSAGNKDRTISLSENAEYTVESNGFNLTVTVKDKSAAITGSDCRDRICVNTGFIKKPGETVVCLPAKASVTIKASEKTGVSDMPDALTY